MEVLQDQLQEKTVEMVGMEEQVQLMEHQQLEVVAEVECLITHLIHQEQVVQVVVVPAVENKQELRLLEEQLILVEALEVVVLVVNQVVLELF